MSETTISRAEAIRICAALSPVVPWPNQWDGSEREQLIFGKGMVAGAKACAEAMREQATEDLSCATTHSTPSTKRPWYA